MIIKYNEFDHLSTSIEEKIVLIYFYEGDVTLIGIVFICLFLIYVIIDIHK